MVAGSSPPHGFVYPRGGSSPTPTSVSHNLQASLYSPRGMLSPHLASTPLSSHSEKHTLEDTGSSKKSRGREEFDMSFPQKKKKTRQWEKVIRAPGNKLSETHHDHFLTLYCSSSEERIKG